MPPFSHLDRKPGDPIKSEDWNAGMNEIVRLDQAKVNRRGADALQGPLTIQEALAIGNISGSAITAGGSRLKIAYSEADLVDVRFSTIGAGQLELVGWTNGWSINAKTDSKHLYLNRDAGSTSDVYVGRQGRELVVKGSDGAVLLSGSLSVTGASTLTGNISMGGTLTVTSNSTLNGPMMVQPTLTTANANEILTAVYIKPTFILNPTTLTGVKQNGLIVESGNVGLGTTSPGARLDVAGRGDTISQISLQLRSGNTANNFNSNQLTFSYNNTGQYRHTIRTRHNGGARSGNAIDFYVWKNLSTTDKDDPDTIGTLHAMTLDGGNVGMGTTSPQAKLDVRGNSNSGTGTISSSGIVVTGDGTLFTSQLKLGDWITATYTSGGTSYTETRRVTSILGTTVTSLTVDAAFTADIPRGTNFTFHSPLLCIQNDGNVGIGTPNPQAKLGIAGTPAIPVAVRTGIQGIGTITSLGITVWGDSINMMGLSPTQFQNQVKPGDFITAKFVNRNVIETRRVKSVNSNNELIIATPFSEPLPQKSTFTIQKPIALIHAGNQAVYPDHVFLVNELGEVGIGTTTPSEKLEVSGNIKAINATLTGTLSVAGTSTLTGTLSVTGTSTLTGTLSVTGTSTLTGNATLGGTLSVAGTITPSAGNTESSGILFPKDPGGGAGDAAWIRYYRRDTSGEACTLEIGVANDANDHIALMPGAGRVGIGTTAPEKTLHIVQAAANDGIRLDERDSAGALTTRYFKIAYEGQGNIHFYHNDNSGQWMSSTGNWNRNSDLSLKEQISSLDGTLDKVMQLRPVHYTWKRSQIQDIGFIAQEVEQVFPELVSSSSFDGEPLKGVCYSAFGVLAVRAIQEMHEKVEALQTEIQLLKAQFS